MYYNKLLKTALTGLISFHMVFTPALASNIDSYDRTAEKIDQFLRSGSPSDIPFLDYTSSFTSENSQPLKRFDLSQYIGKKMFIGYGVYDVDQTYCKYVEKPDLVFPAPDITNIGTFNKHSYAVSPAPMSLDSCKVLAAKYNGTPVMINSASENGYISGKFKEVNGVGYSKWIGLSKTSCLSNYVDLNDKPQDYFNWSGLFEQSGTCDPLKLLAIQNQYGTWNKASNNSLARCVIEVDTEDIKRPIKICAPWWKIEREYQLEESTTYGSGNSIVDIYRVNQADIPDQMNVCVKYNPIAATETAEKPNRDVTCTSYYDATMDSSCIKDPYQAICHVDECSGYVKNACRLKDTISGFKDYTKTEVIMDGSNKIVKGKVGIKTHIYSCPPSLPSSESCEEYANVLIYPKECSSSDCEAYQACYADAVDSAQRAACANDHPCEKIYANPDRVKLKTTGEIDYIEGVCASGEILNFTPSIQSKTSKKCLEYDKYEVSENVSQKCVLDRKYTEHSIDTSITEEDIYMNNPSCIRMNNAIDSRIIREINFLYKNNGYAKTVIKKTYLDELAETPVNNGIDITISQAANNTGDAYGSSVLPATTGTSNSTTQNQCTDFDNDSAIAWYNRQDQLLNNNVTISILTSQFSYLADSMGQDSDSALFVKYTNIPASSHCSAISTKIGGLSTNYDAPNKICKIYLNKYPLDMFSLIKGNGGLQTKNENGETYNEYPEYSYVSYAPKTKDECKRLSTCLDGIYNESGFNNTSTATCSITTGDNYSTPEVPTIPVIDPVLMEGFDENCKPNTTNGAYFSQIDGSRDIFSVQEYVEGPFGYFSNYNSHPYINNFVAVDGKEIFPIKKIPIIDDKLIYEGKITQTSILTKKPAVTAGLLAGAGAGVAVGVLMGVLAGTGVGLVVAVVIMMIMGKKTKMNKQDFFWEIYKLVPVERYVTNIYVGSDNKSYDKRVLVKDPATGNPVIDSQNRYKLLYAQMKGDSGKMKDGDFKNWLKNLLSQKVSLITCLGWMKSDVSLITNSAELDVVVGYPSCKKLSFSCNKSNSQDFSDKKDPFIKKMDNAYVGAVNSLSVVVPYIGTYVLEAYDIGGNKLSEIKIDETEFLDATDGIAKYAQVPFALNMNLATGISEGTTNNACRFDLMTEWGGGISGVYYENNTTGSNQDCSKSHDGYVQTKSAVKIKIKPTNIDRWFVIDLVKPMPFPNRVFLVTLNQKEIREYRCYEPFGSCPENEYR